LRAACRACVHCDWARAHRLGAGIDGVIINMPTNIRGNRPGPITAVGEALKPLVGV
jgi:hypothetical protein